MKKMKKGFLMALATTFVALATLSTGGYGDGTVEDNQLSNNTIESRVVDKGQLI